MIYNSFSYLFNFILIIELFLIYWTFLDLKRH